MEVGSYAVFLIVLVYGPSTNIDLDPEFF
ncbi:Protein CBG26231 [Caenorhabditis briggsae]|uniref:Protein CBG26231 n=1 Tax=Caenorhabditis briggsae TaxID=6238 RepID=B6IIY6_CAEBR|nr:Protein CBG26231 [Caenorhabditis briggsae]CAR99866.1 Protein CBG26231 [Caenorhabditis briggsae]